MATYTSVDVRIPEAALLADLAGIRLDLQRARDFCEKLIHEWTNQSKDFLIMEALSIAATITYARAFSEGTRYWLKAAELDELSETQKKAHEYLIHYRSKHVAHSVNGFEDNAAKANYCLERVHTEGFTSVTHRSSRITTLGGDEIVAMIDLTNTFESYIEHQISIEKEKLLTTIKTLPINFILSSESRQFPPKKAAISKSRGPRTSRKKEN